MSHEDLWRRVLEQLEQELGSARICAGLRRAHLVEVRDETATIEVERAPHRGPLRRLEAELIAALGACGAPPVRRLQLVVARAQASAGPLPVRAHGSQETPGTITSPLDSVALLGLSSYARGPSNEFALRVAEEVARNPGGPWSNPLLIQGGTGNGKTHLLQGIARAMRRLFPRKKIVLVNTEEFVNGYVSAVRNGSCHAFRRLFREADCLLLDDIQILEGKKATQEELLQTMDRLLQRGAQLVFAATVSPRRIPGLVPRLVSRFEETLTVEISPPEHETRREIARVKASRIGLSLSDAALDFLAVHFDDAREMLGALQQVKAAMTLGSGRRGEEALALLEEIVSANALASTPEAIANHVATAYLLRPSQLLGSSRSSPVVRARRVAMALSRELTDLSFKEIGKAFGDRSAAAAHHAVREFEKILGADPLAAQIASEARRRFGKRRPAKPADMQSDPRRTEAG